MEHISTSRNYVGRRLTRSAAWWPSGTASAAQVPPGSLTWSPRGPWAALSYGRPAIIEGGSRIDTLQDVYLSLYLFGYGALVTSVTLARD
jgi:hypothetical protein